MHINQNQQVSVLKGGVVSVPFPRGHGTSPINGIIVQVGSNGPCEVTFCGTIDNKQWFDLAVVEISKEITDPGDEEYISITNDYMAITEKYQLLFKSYKVDVRELKEKPEEIPQEGPKVIRVKPESEIIVFISGIVQ